VHVVSLGALSVHSSVDFKIKKHNCHCIFVVPCQYRLLSINKKKLLSRPVFRCDPLKIFYFGKLVSAPRHVLIHLSVSHLGTGYSEAQDILTFYSLTCL